MQKQRKICQIFHKKIRDHSLKNWSLLTLLMRCQSQKRKVINYIFTDLFRIHLLENFLSSRIYWCSNTLLKKILKFVLFYQNHHNSVIWVAGNDIFDKFSRHYFNCRSFNFNLVIISIFPIVDPGLFSKSKILEMNSPIWTSINIFNEVDGTENISRMWLCSDFLK